MNTDFGAYCSTAEAIRKAVRITNDKQAKYDDVSYRIDTFTYKGMSK